MRDEQKEHLRSILKGLLIQIGNDSSIESCDSVAQKITELLKDADTPQKDYIESYIANRTLRMPEEEKMSLSLRDCVEKCVNSVYQIETKAKLLQMSMDKIIGTELSNKSGTKCALITLEPTDNAKIRATFYDERGFFGDMSRTSVGQLIDELWEDGHRYPAPGTLQKMSSSLRWSDGMSSTLDVQLVNMGSIPMDQYFKNRAIRFNTAKARDVLREISLDVGDIEQRQKMFEQKVFEITGSTPSEKLFELLSKSLDSFITPSDDLFQASGDESAEVHWYGLRARPPSLGAVPKGFVAHVSTNDAEDFLEKRGLQLIQEDFRHGLVGYKDALTAEQIKSFELTVPLVKGAIPELTGDIEDVSYLKSYAMKLMNAGFVEKDELKSVWKDPDLLLEKVKLIMDSKNTSPNRPSVRLK